MECVDIHSKPISSLSSQPEKKIRKLRETSVPRGEYIIYLRNVFVFAMRLGEYERLSYGAQI